MGFLSELKKIFFGVESVSKGAVKKTVDFSKERSEHLLDVTEDFVSNKREQVERKFDNIKSDVNKSGSEFIDNLKQKSSEVIDDITDSEIYKNTVDVVEKAGDKVLDTGELFIEKSKEFIDGPGKKVAETFKETSEDIGETIFAGGKTIANKASEITKNLGNKLDETIQKAEEMAKKEKVGNDNLDFAEKPMDIKDSELNDKDDFFDKADKFASGEYSDNPQARIIGKEENVKEVNNNIDGFTDVDNDGNPLIDDAEIIDENDIS